MPETEIKTVGLYKVTFEKVAEMSGSEAEAVEAHSDLMDITGTLRPANHTQR